jgi:xanthine dehydrogenase accessory factor
LLIWKFIKKVLEKDKNLTLLYVLKSIGSSPGRQGFCMAISEDGKMMGSIGGGIMEHKLVELSKDNLKKKNLDVVIKKQIHSKSASKNQSGMICSGEQIVAFVPLTKKDLDSVGNLLFSLEQNDSGQINLSPTGFLFQDKESTDHTNFSYTDDSNWSYSEKIGFKKFAYILGGGHVGKALTRTLADLDFHVTVIDDRENLHTMTHNEFAHKKLTVDYSTIQQYIPNRQNVYIFIMTFGYRSDLTVLQQLINHEAVFKGMMGSKEKIRKLLDEMKTKGFTEKHLQTIHTPIGLDIKSRTPQEIAISIAAQIIQLDNKDLP